MTGRGLLRYDGSNQKTRTIFPFSLLQCVLFDPPDPERVFSIDLEVPVFATHHSLRRRRSHRYSSGNEVPDCSGDDHVFFYHCSDHFRILFWEILC